MHEHRGDLDLDSRSREGVSLSETVDHLALQPRPQASRGVAAEAIYIFVRAATVGLWRERLRLLDVECLAKNFHSGRRVARKIERNTDAGEVWDVLLDGLSVLVVHPFLAALQEALVKLLLQAIAALLAIGRDVPACFTDQRGPALIVAKLCDLAEELPPFSVRDDKILDDRGGPHDAR